MGEQTATCMCGHPRSDHPDPAIQTDIPPQYRGGCNGDGDCCGCEVFRPRPPITWPAIAAELESIRDQTDRCLRDAADRLEVGHTPDEGVMQAHRVRGQGLRISRTRVDALLAHVAESMPLAPPGRPLEAVLADIEAEGHADITVISLAAYEPGRWQCRSHIDDADDRWQGHADDEWSAWTTRMEWGSVDSAEGPVAAAEARLAQIRELHAEKLERDGLAADVPDDVKRRALDALALLHFEVEAGPACGTDEDQRLTSDPAAVTCPACRRWIGMRRHVVGHDSGEGTYYVHDNQRGVVVASGFTNQNLAIAKADELERLAAEDRQREAEASEARSPDEVEGLHDATDEEEGR